MAKFAKLIIFGIFNELLLCWMRHFLWFSNNMCFLKFKRPFVYVDFHIFPWKSKRFKNYLFNIDGKCLRKHVRLWRVISQGNEPLNRFSNKAFKARIVRFCWGEEEDVEALPTSSVASEKARCQQWLGLLYMLFTQSNNVATSTYIDLPYSDSSLGQIQTIGRLNKPRKSWAKYTKFLQIWKVSQISINFWIN